MAMDRLPLRNTEGGWRGCGYAKPHSIDARVNSPQFILSADKSLVDY
jgi:hypothetical protein